MPRGRLLDLVAVLICLVQALPGEANAAGLQNVKVAGAVARIPSGCKVGRATAEIFECRWTNADLSFRTFAIFSTPVPRFSSVMSDMGLPVEPSKDVDVVLDGGASIQRRGSAVRTTGSFASR